MTISMLNVWGSRTNETEDQHITTLLVDRIPEVGWTLFLIPDALGCKLSTAVTVTKVVVGYEGAQEKRQDDRAGVGDIRYGVYTTFIEDDEVRRLGGTPEQG